MNRRAKWEIAILFLIIVIFVTATFMYNLPKKQISKRTDFYISYNATMRNYERQYSYQNKLYSENNQTIIEFVDEGIKYEWKIDQDLLCEGGNCKSPDLIDRIKINSNIIDFSIYYENIINSYFANKTNFNKYSERIEGKRADCIEDENYRLCLDKKNIPVYLSYANDHRKVRFEIKNNGEIR